MRLPEPPVLAANMRLDDYLRQVHAWTVEVHRALQELVDGHADH